MSIPRSNQVLPRRIDPRKMAMQGGTLQGAAPLAAMSRLCNLIESADGNVLADLSFYRDEQGRFILDGSVEATVQLQCQRCLESMAQPLSGHCRVAVLWSEEQAEQLPKDLDPWLVEDETADLYGLLEEELLLALPIVGFHDESECSGRSNFSSGVAETESAGPFDILGKLKRRD